MSRLPPWLATAILTAAAAAEGGELAPAADGGAPLRLTRLSDGQVMLEVGGAAVDVQQDFVLERQVDGGWESVADTHPLAVESCRGCSQSVRPEARPIARCIALDAGEHVRSPPWSAWVGDRAVGPAPAGVYRLRLYDCRHTWTVVSDEMTLVGPGRFEGVPDVHVAPDDPAGVELVNEGNGPISMHTKIRVFRVDEQGGYVPLADDSMLASADCFPDAGDCITLPPKSRLRALSYRPNCKRCAKCAPAGLRPGTYALQVSSCDRPASWNLDPFVIDKKGVAHAVQTSRH